ncbi:hypothetical protein [Alloprevotella tannerae]
MGFSETFEPQIRSWQEEDKDKRSAILITLEDAGEGKRAAGVSIMGNGFNIAYSIAEALNGSDDLRELFSKGVKLASMMKLEEIKKAITEK